MMSYTTSAAWSRHIYSACYTEHGQRYGVVLLSRITTVVMYRSGQLVIYSTIESTVAACPHALQVSR
jgi:hypothetical protein